MLSRRGTSYATPLSCAACTPIRAGVRARARVGVRARVRARARARVWVRVRARVRARARARTRVRARARARARVRISPHLHAGLELLVENTPRGHPDTRGPDSRLRG